MAFTENLGAFFDQAGFAVEATITPPDGAPRTISAIPDSYAQQASVMGTETSDDVPTLVCKTGDLTGVGRNAKVEFSGRVFRVLRRLDDLTGVTTLFLEFR